MDGQQKNSRIKPWLILGLIGIYLLIYLFTVLEDLFELNLF
jgi:hypothetical protein